MADTLEGEFTNVMRTNIFEKVNYFKDSSLKNLFKNMQHLSSDHFVKGKRNNFAAAFALTCYCLLIQGWVIVKTNVIENLALILAFQGHFLRGKKNKMHFEKLH